MRFSLKTLLLLMTGAAVACFSLIYAHPLIGDAFYTLTVATIALGVVAAIQLQGAQRAYWIGFTTVAAAYFWFALSSPQTQLVSALVSRQMIGAGRVDSQLITTTLLSVCYDTYCANANPNLAGTTPYMGTGPASTMRASQLAQMRLVDPTFAAFMTTGHAVFAILFGALAGVLSRRLYLARVAPATVP